MRTISDYRRFKMRPLPIPTQQAKRSRGYGAWPYDTLRVPRSSLFYRVRGSGPVLLILPSGDGGADATDSPVKQLDGHYTIVTYDRRGLSRSIIDSPGESLTIATHCDNAHRLLAELTNNPRWSSAAESVR